MSINKGDALPIYLDFTVNDTPLVEAELDEIEVYFGDNRYLLSDGTIQLDGDYYYFFLSQEDSFKLDRMYTEYQIRVKKGDEVSSTFVGKMHVGKVLSREVI